MATRMTEQRPSSHREGSMPCPSAMRSSGCIPNVMTVFPSPCPAHTGGTSSILTHVTGGRDDAASGDGLGKLLKDLGGNAKLEIDAGNAERGDRLYVSDEPRRYRRAFAPYEGRESRKRFGIAPAP